MAVVAKGIKKLVLCGPNGPTGVFTLVMGHYHGVTAALKGDNAGAAAAGAGVWGGLSGGVIGFLVGGPVGAFIGGTIGGVAAGEAARAIVKANVPDPQQHPASATHNPTFKVEVDQGFIGKFVRSPKITVGNTAINNHCFFGTQDGRLYWFYENDRYPVGFDENTPDTIYVVHHMKHVGNAKSRFTLQSNGSLREYNENNKETWTWVPADIM